MERRNDELLKLVEAWENKPQDQKVRMLNTLNLREIENLIVRIYQVYKIPLSLYNADGVQLFSIGWKNICLRFHQMLENKLKNCRESVRYIQSRLTETECYAFHCKNNVYSLAIPILVGEQFIGTLVVNQFFFENEKPDYEYFYNQALECGFNFGEYKQTIDDLPILNLADVEGLLENFLVFAEIISGLASKNNENRQYNDILRQKKELCLLLKEKLNDQSEIIQVIQQYLTIQQEEMKEQFRQLSKKEERMEAAEKIKSPVV